MKRLPQKRTIERMISRAKKLWGMDDWTVEWNYADLPHEGESDPRYWTEHRAWITLDKETARDSDQKKIFRIIVHELGHAIVYPVWRAMTDFTDNYLKSAKEKAVYEDSVNSAENIVIDYLITKVFKL